jgi:outer membrane protein assembly factor BamE (lipoprotein component of BamABCDE complex)
MQTVAKTRGAGRFRTRLGAVLACSLCLAACGPQYRSHGYIPPQEDLDQIAIGVDTFASVEETLGSSASGSVLRDNGLYYVRSRMRTFAMLSPEVVDREVVAISFDSNGVVSNVERFGLERGQVVPLARRVTSSGVTDVGFLKQLIGNIGQVGPGGGL